MKAIIVIAAFFIFLFLLPVQWTVSAVAITINNYPSTLTDEQFTITASISGATSGTNYLRIDIYKDGTTNYFGETFNNVDWYGGSTYSQYLPITIQSGVTWSGSIQGRIGSPNTTQYNGEDSYKLRLRRYTSGGGSTASEANASAVNVLISIPTATPIPTDSPTPTLDPTSTVTPTPSKTPTPTKKPTPTKTPTPNKSIASTKTETPMPTSKNKSKVGNTNKGILGFFTDNSNDPPSTVQTKVASAKENWIGKIFILLAIVFTILCVIVIFVPKLRRRNEQQSD